MTYRAYGEKGGKMKRDTIDIIKALKQLQDDYNNAPEHQGINRLCERFSQFQDKADALNAGPLTTAARARIKAFKDGLKEDFERQVFKCIE